MDRTTNFLSELEAELELEFDSERKSQNNNELDSELEFDTNNEYGSDQEQDNEFELDSENDNEFELDSENDNEFEFESDNEFELEYDGGGSRNYESRLYRLLSRPGDNELEFDQELNQVIHDMEQEFFFKGLKKLARKGLQKFRSIAGGTPLGQLVTTASSLARGNLRNALRRAAGLALRGGAGFIPGGSMLAPAVARSLNLEVGTDQESPTQKAKSLVHLAQKSYQNLARQLDPRMTNAKTANTMVKMAMKQAMTGMSQNHHARRTNTNSVVVYVSTDAWNKVKQGGRLIIKLR